MGDIARKLYQRITNFGLAFMLAASSLAVVGPFLTAESVSALPFTSYKLTAQPNSQTIEAGTGVASINVFAEWKSFIGGWNDFNSMLSSTTISAQSDTAEVSTDQSSWYSSVDLTSPRYYSAEGDFYVKSNVVGTHTINFSATIETTEGVRDLSTTATVTVEDTVKPYFEILSPVSGDTVGAGIVNIQVRITEEGSGVDFANTRAAFYEEASFGTTGQIQTESKTLTPTLTPGVYTAAIDTTGHDGIYRLGVSGRDNAGNTRSTAKTNITIDNTVPTFALTDDGSPKTPILDGDVISISKLGGQDIRFSKESLSDKLYVNGGLIFNHGYFNTNKTGKIKAAFKNDGVYILQTEDLAGNKSTPISITVDNTAPESSIEVSSPTGTGDLHRNTVTVTGVVDASELHIKSHWFEITNPDNSLSYAYNMNTSSLTFSFNLDTSKGDGEYKIRYVATDQAKNRSDESGHNIRVITVDNTAPTAPSITKPTARQWFKVTPITTTWSESTDTNGIDRYQVAYHYDDNHTFAGSTCVGEVINGVTLSGCRDEDGTSRNHIPGTGEEGGVTIWVRAVDNAGNAGPWSKSVHYYYDHTDPTVTIIAPTGVVGNSFTVSGEANDNLSLNRVYVQLVNRENNNRYGGTTINLIGEGKNANWSRTYDVNALNLPDGTYAAHVAVVDMAGNTGSAGWTANFTVDTTAPDSPVLGVTGYNSGDFTNQYSITATWTKPSDDTVKYEYRYWNNILTSAYNDVTLAWHAYNLPGNSRAGVFDQGEGTHYIQVRAADAADNWSDWSNIFELTYDATAPEVTLIGDDEVDVEFGSSYAELGATVSDNLDDSVTVDISGTVGLTVGTYVLTYTATDQAGNTSAPVTRTVNVVDTTAPVVTIDALTTTDTTPTLTGTVDDFDTNAAVEVEIDGTVYLAENNGDGTWTLVLTAPLAVGLYTANVTATDASGNEGTATADITVEEVVVEENDPETTEDDEIGTQTTVTPTPPEPFVEGDEPAVEGAQDENGDQDVAAAQDDNTNGDENENNGTIFGLAWYWWLAILAAIAAAWWLIAGALRRRNNEEA